MYTDEAETERPDPNWETYHDIYNLLKDGKCCLAAVSKYKKHFDKRARNILKEATRDGTRSLSNAQMKCFALACASVVRKDQEMLRTIEQMIESNRVPADTHRMGDAQLDDYLKG